MNIISFLEISDSDDAIFIKVFSSILSIEYFSLSPKYKNEIFAKSFSLNSAFSLNF